MLLGVQVTKTEIAKTNEVRRYASFTGSRRRSFVTKRRQPLRSERKGPEPLFGLEGRDEDMLDIVAKGSELGAGEIGENDITSSECSFHGGSAVGVCADARGGGAMDGDGVDGEIWLSELSI